MIDTKLISISPDAMLFQIPLLFVLEWNVWRYHNLLFVVNRFNQATSIENEANFIRISGMMKKI